MEEDVCHDEENQRDGALHASMHVHHILPVFTDEYDEDGSKGVVERIEVGPRGQKLHTRCINVDHSIELVKEDLVPEELHPKQGEDEHANEEQNREIRDLLHCEQDCVQQLSERLPASRQLEHSQEPDTSEGRQGAA